MQKRLMNKGGWLCCFCVVCVLCSQSHTYCFVCMVDSDGMTFVFLLPIATVKQIQKRLMNKGSWLFCWLLIVDCWLLIVDGWLLMVDCWLLMVDGWWLIVAGAFSLVVQTTHTSYAIARNHVRLFAHHCLSTAWHVLAHTELMIMCVTGWPSWDRPIINQSINQSCCLYQTWMKLWSMFVWPIHSMIHTPYFLLLHTHTCTMIHTRTCVLHAYTCKHIEWVPPIVGFSVLFLVECPIAILS